MPRRARFVVPGLAHHITQRGNNRQDVFLSSADRDRYLEILAAHLDHRRVSVLAWCLMTNHVHLVAIPPAKESLSLALGQAHSQYALEWNRQKGQVGHLWQNRFFSCSLETSRVLTAIRYVERNPVRACMVKEPWDWPWSSTAAHIGTRTADPLLDPEWRNWTVGARLGNWDSDTWRETLAEQAGQEVEAIRRATQAGEPFGQEAFLAELESDSGKRLRVLKRGRPATESRTSAGRQVALFK
jgi:putative transposase